MNKIVATTLALGFAASIAGTATAGCKSDHYALDESVQTVATTTIPQEAVSTHEPQMSTPEVEIKPEIKSE